MLNNPPVTLDIQALKSLTSETEPQRVKSPAWIKTSPSGILYANPTLEWGN